MGTEPARVQERLEAALGPAWVIEREVLHAAKLALGTPAYALHEQVTGDTATDHCADPCALGVLSARVDPRRHT